MRVYPAAKGGLYARVHVWATRAELHAHLRAIHSGGRSLIRKCHASWSGYYVLRITKKTGHHRSLMAFGELNFYRAQIGTETVVHEMLHATLAWARRLALPIELVRGETNDGLVDPVEERLCYAQGWMTRQFVTRARKAGLYADPE